LPAPRRLHIESQQHPSKARFPQQPERSCGWC
jgi:hypothetical protein